LLYDKGGEKHYDLISALHKSIRSSDPDAALYWLVRMLRSGEDPLFLARRLVRMASEDIGLADPNALRLAMAAKDSMHFLGSPEGELALAEIAIYLAVAPKSNAVYKAFNEVNKLVQSGVAHDVPMQLRNAPTKLMKNKGWGHGHDYAHDNEHGITAMECLPDALVGSKFYRPTKFGVEERITKRLELIARLKTAAEKS
jgi:putative ATPase